MRELRKHIFSHTPKYAICALSLSGRAAPHTALFPGTKGKTVVTPQLKKRLDRLSVIWCVQAGRPWEALNDVGHKLMLAEFVPDYVGSTISHPTLDKILTSLFNDAKASLVAKLKGAREELKQRGYRGRFCSLQLDMTSIGNDEFCTASVSVIL